jgi:hypothetical protein
VQQLAGDREAIASRSMTMASARRRPGFPANGGAVQLNET